MNGTDALEALFADQGGARNPKPRRRGRGLAITAWILLGLIVLLGAAFFIVDSVLRTTAETVAATAVKHALPDGAVTGSPTVHIDGQSVILQYLSGSFDDVTIDAHSLTIAGVSAPAHIVAHGVPTSIDGRVGQVMVDLKLNAAALTALLGSQGTVSSLGPGTMVIDKSVTLNGVPVSVSATVKPTVQATAKPAVTSNPITLTTTEARVTQAPDGTNPDSFAQFLRDQPPQVVCVADKLPSALPLTAIRISPTAVTISLTGDDVSISRQVFTERGAC